MSQFTSESPVDQKISINNCFVKHVWLIQFPRKLVNSLNKRGYPFLFELIGKFVFGFV